MVNAKRGERERKTWNQKSEEREKQREKIKNETEKIE